MSIYFEYPAITEYDKLVAKQQVKSTDKHNKPIDETLTKAYILVLKDYLQLRLV